MADHRFRNIIWDVDGTLFDTYPALAGAFQAALRDLGQGADLDWITGLAKVSLGHCITTLAARFQANEEDINQAFGLYYDRVRPEDQPLFPGVFAVCEYICSLGGRNVIVTHRGRESTAQLLAESGLTPYFAGCFTRDDGYPKKPHPAAFEAALEIHNLEPGETLTVGDRAIDIQAGQAAGIFSCLFGPPLEGAAADLTINSYAELYQFLSG